jgi:DNA topoisomerase IB
LSDAGNPIYEYSDRQIALRHSEKANRLEALRGDVRRLRAKITKDLKAKDQETRLTALAVGLIDHTAERVGNDDSASRGHYGVTGWLKSQVSFNGGKAKIKYVGKSGVSHNKTVDDSKLVEALKAACDEAKDTLFQVDDLKVNSDKVNQYLEPFDITAKDLRGLRANQVMLTKLKEVHTSDMPTDPKKRKEQLSKEFEKALSETAEFVGHEPVTLRNQYLVPVLEEEFMRGKIVDKLVKTSSLTLRIATSYLASRK